MRVLANRSSAAWLLSACTATGCSLGTDGVSEFSKGFWARPSAREREPETRVGRDRGSARTTAVEPAVTRPACRRKAAPSTDAIVGRWGRFARTQEALW